MSAVVRDFSYPQLPRSNASSLPEMSNEGPRPNAVAAVVEPKFEEIRFARNYQARENILGGIAITSELAGFGCCAVAAIFGNPLLAGPGVILMIVGLALASLADSVPSYNNREVWNRLRTDLQKPEVTFEQMVDTHTLRRLCDYKLVPLETLQRKYRQWIQSPASNGKRHRYSIFELGPRQIISPETFKLLTRNLINQSGAEKFAKLDPTYLPDLREEFRQIAGYPSAKKQPAVQAMPAPSAPLPEEA